MNLQHRINLLGELGAYILSKNEDWQEAQHIASIKNGWFTPEFISNALLQISTSYLIKENLEKWAVLHELPAENNNPKTIGVVMAGNIPLVGFHDFLSVFITGHKIRIKPSSKDGTLIKHLAEKLIEWGASAETIAFAELLNNCTAYIATGSSNATRYFDYYFGKYPHIIRKNRTSVAVLTNTETIKDLEKLADDVYCYFGMGCRSVTKLYVPAGYNFELLIEVFKKYDHLSYHHKYKNNYDYNLAIHLLNNTFYMSTKSLLLIENTSLFSPISQLNFEYYSDEKQLNEFLTNNEDLQCIAGAGYLPFGSAQFPSLNDFADGVNTITFLKQL